MENLVIEHKEMLKKAIGYAVVTAVLAAILIVAKDQFVMSVGTALLLAALLFELLMGVSAVIAAYATEILDDNGITMQNVFGSKTYYWKNLARFEIRWDYEIKRSLKRSQVDAPYIVLKFENPKKKLRFDYLEATDQYIRACYGQPHVDNWTNVGK